MFYNIYIYYKILAEKNTDTWLYDYASLSRIKIIPTILFIGAKKLYTKYEIGLNSSEIP